jgi:hypothetical protein
MLSGDTLMLDSPGASGDVLSLVEAVGGGTDCCETDGKMHAISTGVSHRECTVARLQENSSLHPYCSDTRCCSQRSWRSSVQAVQLPSDLVELGPDNKSLRTRTAIRTRSSSRADTPRECMCG